MSAVRKSPIVLGTGRFDFSCPTADVLHPVLDEVPSADSPIGSEYLDEGKLPACEDGALVELEEG